MSVTYQKLNGRNAIINKFKKKKLLASYSKIYIKSLKLSNYLTVIYVCFPRKYNKIGIYK